MRVRRRHNAVSPMFRYLAPMPPALVQAARERLAKRPDIKEQNAFPCAASVPILDAGLIKAMFAGDATVTGSLAAANPPLCEGRRKPFRNASVPQEAQPFELLALRNQRPSPAENLDQAKCSSPVSPAFPERGSARVAAWANERSRLSAPHASGANPLARMPTMPDAPGSGA